MKAPKYRKNSSRDRAFVEWNGKREYLPGRYNSQESLAAYKAFLQKNCGVSVKPPRPQAQGLTVVSLLASFLVQLLEQQNGVEEGVYNNHKFALKPFAAEYGHLLAAELGPLALKRWQEKLAEKGLARLYIASCVTYIRQAFRWGVSEELIPASVWHGLQSVQRLKAGKTPAKEQKKRRPVPWSHVEILLPYLTTPVRAMVLLQWFSGVRSMSVCMARPEQFTRDGEFLLWRPRHKMEHQFELVLPLGPRAQEILAPYLADTTSRWLFSPRELSTNRRYGERYPPRSYYNAVQVSIRRMNKELAKTCTPSLPRWKPHQLRHSKGHAVRTAYGLEAVQAVLGHAKMNTSEVYSDARLDLARLVARETG